MTELQAFKLLSAVFLLCVINAAFQSFRKRHHGESHIIHFIGYLGLGVGSSVLTAFILAAIYIIFN